MLRAQEIYDLLIRESSGGRINCAFSVLEELNAIIHKKNRRIFYIYQDANHCLYFGNKGIELYATDTNLMNDNPEKKYKFEDIIPAPPEMGTKEVGCQTKNSIYKARFRI